MKGLADVSILEVDSFRRAGIVLLDLARSLLIARRLRLVFFPESRGRARLVNLLQWQVGDLVEYVDGDSVSADQVVHFAVHQMMDTTLGSLHPHTLLFAETLASASDLYLIGKLSQSGEETDFLAETLESFSYYYELYAGAEDHLEDLLIKVTENPFQSMVTVADYLYDFCQPLLYPESDLALAATLRPREASSYYPLAHHYNISNWVLTIRARFPRRVGPVPDLDGFRSDFLGDENRFLALFRDPPGNLSGPLT